MVETILVPTDGSRHAQRAAAHAIALAEREDATIRALYVVDTDDFGEPALSSAEILVTDEEQRGRAVLEAVETAARKRGVPVETTCTHGKPAEAIKTHADEVEADLVVLGERGETHDLREGTVTRKLRRDDDDRIVVV
mgnify:CR=1 FL=1